MATLLQITPAELNELAKKYGKIYSIASRCGVFAKSDVQPLLNQGASREDISASILSAVVSQTIAGLAQGRPIEGNVVYLGGPLTFLSELRRAFDRGLDTAGCLPEDSLYYVALGAALAGEGMECSLDELIEGLAPCRPRANTPAAGRFLPMKRNMISLRRRIRKGLQNRRASVPITKPP
jgi:hypothetical protein